MDDELLIELTLNFVKRRILTTIYAHPKRSPTFEEIVHMNGFEDDKVKDVEDGLECLVDQGVVGVFKGERVFYYIEDEFMEEFRREGVLVDHGLSEGYLEDPKRESVRELEEVERPDWLWR